MQILDHGSLELIGTWGSDEDIVSAARMSTGGAFKGWGPSGKCTSCGWTTPKYEGTRCPKCSEGCGGSYTVMAVDGDERLLRYLWTNKHATPFEMAGLTFEIQAPIVVFREWHRHRTQSYSEASARYAPLPDLNYVPTVERCLIVAGKNRQAGAVKGADDLTTGSAEAWLFDLEQAYISAEAVYQNGLARGLPKELARLVLPVGRYSRMRASANLRNWLGFLTLRMAPDAQQEIREYANAIGTVIADKFPRTWALFSETLRK